MSIKKRITSILLIMLMVISIIPLTTKEVQAASQADDIVAVAETYLGKNLSQTKSAMQSKGGPWYSAGFSGYWCAWFVSNCARQAGISTSLIENSITADREFYQKNGTYKTAKYYGGSYTPVKGDLIFFDWWEDEEGGRNNMCDHIGIVTKVSGGYIYTVEGNSSNIVKKNSYSLNSPDIRGYAHPKYLGSSSTKTFYVDFDANGGSGTMSRQTITYNVETAITKNKYTKKGYTFAGWEVTTINEYGDGKNYARYISPDRSQNGWYVVGKQPSGWDYHLYGDGTKISRTTSKDKGVCIFKARWKPNTFYVNYKPGGGTGEMPKNQKFIYDKAGQTLAPNQYTRKGYIFEGWQCVVLNENNDGKDYGAYKSPDGSESKWYVVGTQPSGWTWSLYKDQNGISRTTYKNNGEVIFTAQWRPIVFNIQFDGNGATSGTMGTMRVAYDHPITLLKNKFKKEGYRFKGWSVFDGGDGTTAYMSPDGTQKKWYMPGTQPSGWVYELYKDENTISRTSYINEATVTFTAQWEKVSHTHTWDGGKVTKKATCTENGVRTYTCKNCGATKTSSISAIGHSYGSWTKLNNNQHQRVCKNDSSHVQKANHTWVSGVVTKQPTTSAEGVRTYTCTVCNGTKTESISRVNDTTSSQPSKPSQPSNITIAKYRFSGSNRVKTSIAVADELLNRKGKFDNVIVAFGGNFPDALSGGYLSDVKNAPLLLVDQGSENLVAAYISKNIKSNGTVYILGGTGVVRKAFEQNISSRGIRVDRLSGASRYETNLEILREAVGSGEEIVVASGKNYPDSLSGSPLGRGMLLVGDSLTNEQIAYIRNAGISKFYILGGTGAVNKTIENQLRNYAPVERIAGSSRYETSKLIADRFFPKAKAVTLVCGTNFPDGLSGAPLAMDSGSPIILVTDGKYSFARNYVKAKGVTKVYIIGGTGAVSNNLVQQIVA